MNVPCDEATGMTEIALYFEVAEKGIFERKKIATKFVEKLS